MKKQQEVYTKFEEARIIGARALQISASAPILLKLSKQQLEELHYDPIKIAKLEFEAGVLPITVKRPMPKKVERPLVEKPVVEIVKEEKELPKPEIKIEEEALIEEEAERELEEAERTEAEASEASELAEEE